MRGLGFPGIFPCFSVQGNEKPKRWEEVDSRPEEGDALRPSKGIGVGQAGTLLLSRPECATASAWQ